MIKKFNEYNEKKDELKSLADEITKIDTDEEYEKVQEVEILQITGVISEEEANKIDETFVVHAGDFSGKEIKRGDTVWLSCLMKKPGLSYSPAQQGVLKTRISDIYLGLSKLNQLMK